MKRRLVLAILACLLAGCATVRSEIETPVTIVAVVSQPTFTGWYRDYCRDGNLTGSMPNCLQHGGEIYRVTLHDVRTIDGKPVTDRLIIAFPAHALGRTYREEKQIDLVEAPEVFVSATGIIYLANDWKDT